MTAIEWYYRKEESSITADSSSSFILPQIRPFSHIGVPGSYHVRPISYSSHPAYSRDLAYPHVRVFQRPPLLERPSRHSVVSELSFCHTQDWYLAHVEGS